MIALQIKLFDLSQKHHQDRLNELSKIDNLALNQIYGGNVPNSEQTAVILAYANTDPSRDLAGAIVEGQNVAIDVTVADLGSSGNVVNQRNG
jgi:hypothetical protein